MRRREYNPALPITIIRSLNDRLKPELVKLILLDRIDADDEDAPLPQTMDPEEGVQRVLWFLQQFESGRDVNPVLLNSQVALRHVEWLGEKGVRFDYSRIRT